MASELADISAESLYDAKSRRMLISNATKGKIKGCPKSVDASRARFKHTYPS